MGAYVLSNRHSIDMLLIRSVMSAGTDHPFQVRTPTQLDHANTTSITLILLFFYLLHNSHAPVLREPLRTRKNADFLIPDEIDDDHRPRRVGGEDVVEFWCERTKRRQARPRYRRKIMVLIMISDLDVGGWGCE